MPIARLVRIGQGASGYRTPNPQVVELGGLRTQAGRDIAQTLSIGQLREGRAAKLIGAAEIADSMIAALTLDDATEGLPRKMVHQLSEHQLADVHAHPRWLRRQ
jgi:hypothetical protein